MAVTVDLSKDAEALRVLLKQRVNAYSAKSARSSKVPRISAVEVGYCFDQSGWIHVNLDPRPKHERDGEWTLFKTRDLLMRPQWEAADTAIMEKASISLIMADGHRETARLTEKKFSAALGRMIKGVLLEAKKDGLFAALPKRNPCQLDIEEFNGSWAWPAYEKLGKVNLI